METLTQPKLVRASRWRCNGDHPLDDVTRGGTTPDREEWEGRVVRYYRDPRFLGHWTCATCGHRYSEHGFIDSRGGGQKVCPGDWILDADDGTHHVCKVDLAPFYVAAIDIFD